MVTSYYTLPGCCTYSYTHNYCTIYVVTGTGMYNYVACSHLFWKYTIMYIIHKLIVICACNSNSLLCPLNYTVDCYLFNSAGYVKEPNPKKVTGIA